MPFSAKDEEDPLWLRKRSWAKVEKIKNSVERKTLNNGDVYHRTVSVTIKFIDFWYIDESERQGSKMKDKWYKKDILNKSK